MPVYTVVRYEGKALPQLRLFCSLHGIEHIIQGNALFFDYTYKHLGQARRRAIDDYIEHCDDIGATEFDIEWIAGEKFAYAVSMFSVTDS